MTTYKYELDTLFSNIKYELAHKGGIPDKLNECHTRALAIVTELLASIETYKLAVGLFESGSGQYGRENESLHGKIEELEKDKIELTTCVKALARVIGGEL